MESDGVMDGRHSTFQNVFEMRQNVEPRRGRRRDPSRNASAGARVRAFVSIFKLIQTRRGHILRSPARPSAAPLGRMPAKPHIKNTDDGWQAGRHYSSTRMDISLLSWVNSARVTAPLSHTHKKFIKPKIKAAKNTPRNLTRYVDH